jgi:hypothetical protein
VRDQIVPTQESATLEARAPVAWSAPTLTELPIAELTQGVSGLSFDADVSPQS